MEIFWIVVGVVVVVIYIISQNRTKVSNRTVITRNRTIQTEDGEIKVQETQVVDSISTEYTRPNTINQESHQAYDKAAIDNYNANISHKRAVEIEARKARQDTLPVKVERVINPQPAPASVPAPASAPASVPVPVPVPVPVTSDGKKQCTRCRINLPHDKFRRSSKNPDGLTIWCASCLDGPKNTRHMKWCPMCNVRRKRTSFYPNTENADKLMAWCKGCIDARNGR